MLKRLLIAAFLLPAAPAEAETWMLMGREGGCLSLEEAAKRKPIFEGVTSPEELRAKLRSQGERFTYEEHTAAGQRVVLINAAALGLAIILAPESICDR